MCNVPLCGELHVVAHTHTHAHTLSHTLHIASHLDVLLLLLLSPALLWLYPLLPQLYLRYGTHVSDVRQRVDEEKMRENTGPPCVLVPNRYADDCDRQPGGEKKGESFRRHLEKDVSSYF